MRPRLLRLLALLPFVSATASAETMTVCASGCDYATIQDAIDAAAPGDIIEIQSGLYTEPTVEIRTPGLTLVGIAGAKGPATVLDGEGIRPLIHVDAVGTLPTTLRDLRIQNGYHPLDSPLGSQGGGGIHGMSDLTVIDCEIVSNQSERTGGGILMESGDLLLQGVLVRSNGSAENGGGIRANGIVAEGCRFESNHHSVGLHPPAYSPGGGAVAGSGNFANCEFRDNSSAGSAVYGHATFDRCTFELPGASLVGNFELVDCTVHGDEPSTLFSAFNGTSDTSGTFRAVDTTLSNARFVSVTGHTDEMEFVRCQLDEGCRLDGYCHHLSARFVFDSCQLGGRFDLLYRVFSEEGCPPSSYPRGCNSELLLRNMQFPECCILPFNVLWEADALTTFGGQSTHGCDDCPGDLNCDRSTDATDLGLMLGSWTLSNGADLDGDGEVRAGDLGILLASWGPCD